MVKMDNDGNSSSFVTNFDKLICEEDSSQTDDTIYSSHEKQQVTMSLPRPDSSPDCYRLLTISLAVLAVLLLAVNIGLGVYYNRLAGGQQTIVDIHTEMAKLQAGYHAAIQSRIDAKKHLDRELSEQQRIQWELEHQNRRSVDYDKQIKKIQDEISALNSQIPLLKTGCRHCAPGWSYTNERCVFIAYERSLRKKSWNEARRYCQAWGSDLVVIDTTGKAAAIATLINLHQDPLVSIYQSGFWIGLSDVTVEGVWRWMDGRILIESFWWDGEPNNANDEDCAATYPGSNPFQTWNDVPCSHSLWWICEMDPRMTS